MMSEQEMSDEEIINPFTMILPTEEQDSITKGQSTLHASPGEPLVRHHHLRSIDATLAIRQLPSEGLSFQLWPAATTLVTLLDNHRRDPSRSPLASVLSASSDGPDRRQLSILELGSGTGLVGIAAAVTLGASVTVTDLPHVAPNLRFNAEANAAVLEASGGNVVVSALRWGEEADVAEAMAMAMAIGRGGFDLIVASDVVYHDHLYEPLLKTLYSLLLGRGAEKTTSFLMAHLRRWKKESSFFKKAKKVFDVEVLFKDRRLEGSRVGVVVYRFSPKRNGKKTKKNKSDVDGGGDTATSANGV